MTAWKKHFHRLMKMGCQVSIVQRKSLDEFHAMATPVKSGDALFGRVGGQTYQLKGAERTRGILLPGWRFIAVPIGK